FHTVILELAGQIDHVVTGELAPAVGGNLAVASVQPHDDVAGEGAAGVAQETGVLHCCGADDDVGNAVVEVVFNGVQVANAAADLDGNIARDGVNNRLGGSRVLRRAGHGAFEVHRMQETCAVV